MVGRYYVYKYGEEEVLDTVFVVDRKGCESYLVKIKGDTLYLNKITFNKLREVE